MSVFSKAAMLKELWLYMRANKKWWLLPLIVIVVLFGLLAIFAQSSAIAPFIYTIF